MNKISGGYAEPGSGIPPSQSRIEKVFSDVCEKLSTPAAVKTILNRGFELISNREDSTEYERSRARKGLVLSGKKDLGASDLEECRTLMKWIINPGSELEGWIPGMGDEGGILQEDDYIDVNGVKLDKQ
jgi:hypothetical protein